MGIEIIVEIWYNWVELRRRHIMEQSNKPTNLVEKLKDYVQPQYLGMLSNAIKKFSDIPYYNDKSCNYVIFENSIPNIYEDDTDLIIDIPAQFLYKGVYYNAEINLVIDKTNDIDGEVHIGYVCSGEIMLNVPLNKSSEIKKYLTSKNGNYRMPKGSEIVSSKYLGKTFFAFSKDYTFYAKYDPTQEVENIKLSEFEILYSAKAHKSTLFYHTDNILNKGAMQVFNEVLVYNLENKPMERLLCKDIVFPNIRELRQYRIIPTKNGSTIQRSEYGMDIARKRTVPMTTLSKHIGTDFEKLGSMSNLAMIFEKQCRMQDRSKLITLQQEKDMERQKRCVVERMPKYVQKKKRLAPYNPNDTYEDYKIRKENSHDQSIKYAKQNHTQNNKNVENTPPEGVLYLW